MTESLDPLIDPRLAGFRTGLAGRYQLVRQIGEGGMAVVLLARDLQHDRLVALKVLHPELTRALGGERFHQEIRLTAKVQHPHIVSIYASGEAGGQLWYSMPYVEGESLRQRLNREEQLPLPDAIRIILETAKALAAAHQAGVVHRDIKPENILLTSTGDVYVVDFGVARAVDSASLTRTGLAVGTPQYMSPEQASGNTTVSPRSDVYTLGCVLFEMLAGEPPFSARTPQAVSAKHLHSPVPDVRIVRETVSPALQLVLETALAKSAADRYADAGAFAAAIEKALTAPKLAWWKRRELAQAVGAAGVVSLLAIGAMLLWPRPLPAPVHKNPPTIAVLYFENSDPDTSLNAVADAVTEEVIREFTGASTAFHVVSKFGVRQFKNGLTPIDTMRIRLSADYWIAGDIRRAGAGVVVDAQLIDALTNIVIDSASIPSAGVGTHELAANAAVRLAGAIKRHLKVEVRLSERVDTSTVPLANSLLTEAERYRRDAEQYRDVRDVAGVAAGLAAFNRADSLLGRVIQEDPKWLKPWIARAWVGLGKSMLQSEVASLDTRRRALVFADTAVARAPTDGSALEVRGTLRYRVLSALNSDDTSAYHLAEMDLRDAVGRDSLKAGAWATLGDLLWLNGKLQESDVASRMALQVDPFLDNADAVRNTLFVVNTTMARFSEAGVWCQRMRAAHPDDWYSRQCELTLLRHDLTKPPDPERAWQLVAELDSIDPLEKAQAAGRPITAIYRRLVAGAIDARAGNRARAESTLVWARRTAANDSVLKVDMAADEAYLLLKLGRRDSARALVEHYFRLRPVQRRASEQDPLYRELIGLSKEAPGTPPR